MTRAWSLARVSTTKKEQAESPEHQLTALRGYYAIRGWVEVGSGVDTMTGARFDRPALMEAMAAIRARKVDALCVTDLDRLGRNLRELFALADELKARGVHLVILSSAEGIIDTSTTNGFLLFGMLALLADFFRRLYRDKSIRGQQAARAKGKHIGRPRLPALPWGVLQKAAERRAKGASWGDLAWWLRSEGFHRPDRRSLARGTVARLVGQHVDARRLSKSPLENVTAIPATGAELAGQRPRALK